MKKIYLEGQSVEVSDEVFVAYMQGDRKMRYMEQDLKVERIVIDPITRDAKVIQSREDSFDRLTDEIKQEFAAQQDNVEEITIRNIMISEMREYLKLLNESEKALVNALYFQNMLETKYAKKIGISKQAVNQKMKRTINKLRNMMNIKK